MMAQASVNVIHLLNQDGAMGEPVAIQSPQFAGPRIRFTCAARLEAGTRFVFWAAGTGVQWVKYCVLTCEEQADGSAQVMARPDGVFEGKVG